MSGSAFAVTHHAFSSGAGRTFDGNGSHASTLKSPSYTKSVSWQHYPLSASLKSAAILNHDFSFLIDYPLVHTYVPLRKSMFEECWRLYRAELRKFLSNKFRTNDDLNLATFFVPWLSYIRGVSVPSRDICYYFNIRSPAAATYFNALQIAKNNGTLVMLPTY
ncbi:stealth conserved region 3 domain-containing protein [Escherichia coli]|uniref:stealth conserved region 3 domain-containing protein n=1 Tax=Escherichia coli TaxID=562 RepID=UPI001839E545|nr:hypothetical protein [Escherichia coli]